MRKQVIKISQRRVCPAEGTPSAKMLKSVLSLAEEHHGGQMAAGWQEQVEQGDGWGDIREVVRR